VTAKSVEPRIFASVVAILRRDASRATRYVRSMKTVLVVEDTEDLRELFVELLREAGYPG
jgi:hypothetical protein